MNIKNVLAGENPPEDIYAIIEIPANSYPIKYELEKKTSVLFVDRIIPTAMFYPCNYGYINQTLSLDQDPVDVLVPTPYPLQSYSVIQCRPVGMLNMIDESGKDCKLIAVPTSNICKEYEHIKDIFDISKTLLKKISHFFEHYKALESGKWTKIDSWKNVKEAKDEIVSSLKRFKNIL